MLLHTLHNIAQEGVADVFVVGLVVDVEQLQFVSHDAHADDDPCPAALATSF